MEAALNRIAVLFTLASSFLPLSAAPPPLASLARPGHQATLVVLAPPGDPLPKKLSNVLLDQALADCEIQFESLHDPWNRSRDMDLFRNQVGPKGWALLAGTGAILASGIAPPGAEALLKALDTPETRPPLVLLRAFLQSHPENLEAREAFMTRLRARACARTRLRLGITGQTLNDDLAEGHYKVVTFLGTEMPDAAPFRNKPLGAEDDVKIWAAYAQELDKAFRQSTWESMNLGWNAVNALPFEACSSTMRTLFRIHRPKVQAALERQPDAKGLWLLWLDMSLCIDGNFNARFLDSLTAPPPEARVAWPPEPALTPLVANAKKRHDWSGIRDLLVGYRSDFLKRTSTRRQILKADPTFLLGMPIDWDGRMGPLVEALIQLGEDPAVQELVEAFQGSPETSALVPRAASLARACGRLDLANRWTRK
jgi:hypothetical protein